VDSSDIKLDQIKNIDSIGVLLEYVMERLVKNEFVEAMKLLSYHTIMSENTFNIISSTFLEKKDDISKAYGEIVGYEEISNRKIGSSLIEKIFICKYEECASRFRFRFYNGKNGWKLIAIKYDLDIDTLFE
jgi:hypothetical protein